MVKESDVIEKLKTIIDPELEVDIYDLGLVYRIDVNDAGFVYIDMTLTAEGCPIGEIIKFEAEEAVKGIPGVSGASVRLVWNPHWDTSMIKNEAIKKLTMKDGGL